MKPGDGSATYTATIEWARRGAVFTDNRYSRGHRWEFDGGVEVPASASPHSVPLPLSVAEAVDPEEAFVASVASCHMLWFLSIAAQQGHVVESYRDAASATLGRDGSGQLAILRRLPPPRRGIRRWQRPRRGRARGAAPCGPRPLLHRQLHQGHYPYSRIAETESGAGS